MFHCCHVYFVVGKCQVLTNHYTLVFWFCNAFWTQVFKAYDEFHNKIKLTNAGEVLSEPICFNQRIRIGNTFLMHKHWIDKCVYCVAHFLNEEGKILSHIDFQRKFDITIDFVTYSVNKEISA